MHFDGILKRQPPVPYGSKTHGRSLIAIGFWNAQPRRHVYLILKGFDIYLHKQIWAPKVIWETPGLREIRASECRADSPNVRVIIMARGRDNVSATRPLPHRILGKSTLSNC